MKTHKIISTTAQQQQQHQCGAAAGEQKPMRARGRCRICSCRILRESSQDAADVVDVGGRLWPKRRHWMQGFVDLRRRRLLLSGCLLVAKGTQDPLGKGRKRQHHITGFLHHRRHGITRIRGLQGFRGSKKVAGSHSTRRLAVGSRDRFRDTPAPHKSVVHKNLNQASLKLSGSGRVLSL
ncbi:hypothetical protein L596_011098 [Steinernema carpocapsae]|uniref:Uncharacterized protein n=1 Tax=Steinernema carpocapsae TaxID=34508 RepID=A0A4U5NTL5_STECR|nr:hypothetical protein L596_011098 [Steinernema carpocapsae]